MVIFRSYVDDALARKENASWLTPLEEFNNVSLWEAAAETRGYMICYSSRKVFHAHHNNMVVGIFHITRNRGFLARNQ
jgi:hypothetical protein